MAAPECEREMRKRRERRDSGCAHERKERRPHSEERESTAMPSPLHEYNRLESERRAERLSRARRPQCAKKKYRQPPKQDYLIFRTKENCQWVDEENSNRSRQYAIAVQKLSVGRASVGPENETIDLAAFHHRLERDEPILSAEYTRAQEEFLRTARIDCPDERRVEKINKKINGLKNTIIEYEHQFKAVNGCSMSAIDRVTDTTLNKMFDTLRRLQLEKRCIRSDPADYAIKLKAAKQQKIHDQLLDEALKSDKPMAEVVEDIEEWLHWCRIAGNRPLAEEPEWTPAQYAAEKQCVQRALLKLEAARGRPPAHSEERGAARTLYERYRNMKRAVAADTITPANELGTIHEHEAFVLFSSVDSSSDSQEKPSEDSQEAVETPVQSPPARADTEELPSSSSAKSMSEEAPSNEGLHCLGLEDLTSALREAKMQKCVLRRSIKDYEMTFEAQNSRKLQRDDKKGKEEEYAKYKAIKARIKLLNALINKQKAA